MVRELLAPIAIIALWFSSAPAIAAPARPTSTNDNRLPLSSLAGLPFKSVSSSAAAAGRAYEVSAQTFSDRSMQSEFDVLFGPADHGSTTFPGYPHRVSIWSTNNRVHAPWMRKAGLSRIVVIHGPEHVQIVVDLAPAAATQTAAR